jgi:ABC-2 type transport system ATP-binding protein
LEKAQSILGKLEFISSVDIMDNFLKVRVSSQYLSDINKALVDNGVEVTAIIPRTSLEDYFLSLTQSENYGG